MDMRTVTLLTELAHADAPTQARAGLGAERAQAWRAAGRAVLTVLLGAALTAAPVLVWAAWLRGR